MAEESSGKGIALVILGIVAIIAIVGLVLLFTGAKKATGEFAVPSVKEYGGAIRGVYDPYSRAFTGRSYEYASGNVGTYGGLGGGANPVSRGGSDVRFGESSDALDTPTTHYSYRTEFNRDPKHIDSNRVCHMMSYYAFGYPKYPVSADANEAVAYQAMGRSCVTSDTLNAESLQIDANYYANVRDNIQPWTELAKAERIWCCQAPSL